MPRVKIKQLEERIATAGMHFGGGLKQRKLEPGEVVDIPEDLFLPDGRSMFDVVFATGKLELTLEPATRSLTYKDEREARYCSPSFKPRDALEEDEMHAAREEVAERMRNQPSTPAEKPRVEKLDPQSEAPSRPRARRRVITRSKTHGTENTS